MSRSRCSSSFFFLTLEHKPPRAAPVRRFFVACKVTVGRGTHKKSGSYFHPFFFSLYSTVSPSKRKKILYLVIGLSRCVLLDVDLFFSALPCSLLFLCCGPLDRAPPFFSSLFGALSFFSVNNAHDHARGLRSTPFFPPIQALAGMAMEGLPFLSCGVIAATATVAATPHVSRQRRGGGHCAIHK